MSDWLDQDQKRRNADAAAARHRDNQTHKQQLKDAAKAAKDKRKAERKIGKEKAKTATKRARRDRRHAFRQRWARHTRTDVLYQRGTIGIAAFSVLASLPAQVLHFWAIGWMALPIPFAIEGVAWVLAIGIAFAGERQLSHKVRWLLRVLTVSAAAFAAWVNYDYATKTIHNSMLGWCLGATSMLGPLVFELRQWVLTLGREAKGHDKKAEKAAADHLKKCRTKFPEEASLADGLVLSRPYGTLTFEAAFKLAWKYIHGTDIVGVTANTVAVRIVAQKQLSWVLADANTVTPERTAARLETVLGTTPEAIKSPQVKNQMPPSPKKAPATPPKAPGKRGPKVRQVPPRRTKGDTPKYSQGARIQASETARISTAPTPRLAAVNGSR